MAHPQRSQLRSGAVLSGSWGLSRRSWNLLGRSWRPLGGSLRALGEGLGVSWRLFGCSWGGLSCGLLGDSWAVLEATKTSARQHSPKRSTSRPPNAASTSAIGSLLGCQIRPKTDPKRAQISKDFQHQTSCLSRAVLGRSSDILDAILGSQQGLWYWKA